MNYRVVICGAGPGGVVMARELASAGIDVCIYEKGNYDSLGHDWSDAIELIALETAGLEMPTLEGTLWKGKHVKTEDNPGGLFEPHAIPYLQVYSPDFSSVKIIKFYMITTDRRNLGQFLVNEALEAGAKIKYGHEGLELIYSETGNQGPHGVIVEGLKVKNLDSGETEDVQADLVVESSGFSSVLRRSLPAYTGLARRFSDHEFALVNREVRLRDREKAQTDIIPDHYRYGFHTGYQWTHIHNDNLIDVGSGVRHDPANPDPKDIIEEFISRHDSILAETVRGGRSLCIVGPPLTNFVTNGFITIGDAASTSVPTTGCGAGSAMLAGLWASETVISAARENKNSIAALWGVNTQFYLDHERGASLAALSVLRTILQTFSHEELSFLYSSDILDQDTLENTINGIYTKPAPGKMVSTLIKGFHKPAILIKLNKGIQNGNKTYNHYRNYPPAWNPDEFKKWHRKAEELANN